MRLHNLEPHQVKDTAQKSADAAGVRIYYYKVGRAWEFAAQAHPEYSTNPFNYCDPSVAAQAEG